MAGVAAAATRVARWHQLSSACKAAKAAISAGSSGIVAPARVKSSGNRRQHHGVWRKKHHRQYRGWRQQKSRHQAAGGMAS